MSDVAERIKSVTAETLKVDLSRVEDQSRFVEDLGASSMESVELVAAFEEEDLAAADRDRRVQDGRAVFARPAVMPTQRSVAALIAEQTVADRQRPRVEVAGPPRVGG